MSSALPVLCIGSVLWDVIGRADGPLAPGGDIPGRIRRLPGGVAMNIAMALRRFDIPCELLSAVGDDAEGRALLAAARGCGIGCDHIHVAAGLPTDRYMAIEAAGGLVAALADARSLEAAGARILSPLGDGRLADAATPWAGTVALDGNLTAALLAEIAAGPLFARADLRLAPASPGKARRLRPFLGHRRATLYLNLEEACLLTGTPHETSTAAARALVAGGLFRALVTAGAGAACAADAENVITLTPPEVPVRRITGAGDLFMAAHVAAERRGAAAAEALQAALAAAARHVSQEELP